MVFEILTFVFGATTIAGIYSSWNLMKKQEITEDWLVALENRLSNIIKETIDIDDKVDLQLAEFFLKNRDQ